MHWWGTLAYMDQLFKEAKAVVLIWLQEKGQRPIAMKKTYLEGMLETISYFCRDREKYKWDTYLIDWFDKELPDKPFFIKDKHYLCKKYMYCSEHGIKWRFIGKKHYVNEQIVFNE